ncbi:hypothetical protein [Fusibacter sp. 3D3]|uniref:hypothetical protein n=1 Tax=Fusibacter sp. 3D3 TaxID=1048380 RepID=UPI000853DDE6|nr:hypothetical protein [Fusibacter sp. 3D3]GAU77899.1 hypothetical protein F3D3_2528 [Fusibacter sp. 3D3]
MDDKSIEKVLKHILEIDDKTESEVQRIKLEILEREKQLKNIKRDIEENSNKLKTQQSKKLQDLIMDEANREKIKIEMACSEELEKMDALFEAKKELMVKKAIQRLSLEKGGA